ncbi:MAG: hypothetical protein WC842_01475 [Candidatus Paceibacterota bacterium]|jgi:DNA polymerase III delta subunit
MIIFLYGADIYRREVKVKELLTINREKKKNADIKVFDLCEEKEKWREAKEFLSQPSMFSDTKTVVIYGSGEVDIKEWRELLKKEIHTKDHVIIISDEKAPKKNFQFLLDPNIKTSEYTELDEKKLEVFLKREAERLDVSLDNESWKLFVLHIESFPLRSAAGVRELEKCALFSKNKILNEDGLRSIIQTSETEDVYGVARTLTSERRREKRMAILERALINKVDPAHLFNTLVYVVNGVGIERLAQLDVKIKSGNAEYEEALLEFVLH